MAAIHLIERNGNLVLKDKNNSIWETGFWVLSMDVANDLIGGDIYLHQGQLEPSHFGGVITGYSVCTEVGARSGRLIFTFKADIHHKNVRTDKKGWGNEKKIIR